MSKQRHHIVQDKYLAQWVGKDGQNQLSVYVIPENKVIERGPGWKGFWREDFNVLQDEQEKSYLPEEITAEIDTKAIEVIRNIDTKNKRQLSPEERSTLAFYITLQYVRTERYRDETDKVMDATIKQLWRHDTPTIESVRVTKEEVLNHEPQNEDEKKELEEIRKLSEEEIKKKVYDYIHSDTYTIGLTKTGHSKSILKVSQRAKEFFQVQWMFLVAPDGTSFITSDSPCFAISPTKVMNGLLSPTSIIIFPLRPDLCLFAKPSMKSTREQYLRLEKKEVRHFNQIILQNSSNCIATKDLNQLQNLIKGFDYQKHRSSRDINIIEDGPYTMFNLE